MEIGRRLRDLREAKNLSQGDIEERTRLIRSYISRVENGHTIPSIETLEKFARAFGVPTYQLFIGFEEERGTTFEHALQKNGNLFGKTRHEKRYVIRLARLLGQMSQPNRALLFSLAGAMAKRNR